MVDGLGGGICQVSSTLYNAVVMADLEVLERKNHSLSVSYVKLGRDATVVYGSIDFRFKNSRQYPIKISSKISGGTLTIEIYGYNTNLLSGNGANARMSSAAGVINYGGEIRNCVISNNKVLVYNNKKAISFRSLSVLFSY